MAAAERALAGETPTADLLRAARETARAHDLDVERRAFLDILDRVDELWAAAGSWQLAGLRNSTASCWMSSAPPGEKSSSSSPWPSTSRT